MIYDLGENELFLELNNFVNTSTNSNIDLNSIQKKNLEIFTDHKFSNWL